MDEKEARSRAKSYSSDSEDEVAEFEKEWKEAAEAAAKKRAKGADAEAQAEEKEAGSKESEAEAESDEAEVKKREAEVEEERINAEEAEINAENQETEAKSKEAQAEEGEAEEKEGATKKAWKWTKENYDWEKEKRQAKFIGRNLVAGGRVSVEGAKSVGRGVKWTGGAGKDLAKGGAALGGAVAKGLGKGLGKGMGAVKTAGYGMSKLAAGTSEFAGGVTMFFYMALGAHLLDVITGFGRENSGITALRFSIYAMLMLYAWFVLFGGGREGLRSLGTPAIISGIAFFLPVLISFLLKMVTTGVMADTITASLIFIPIWPVVTCFAFAPAENHHLALWRIAFVIFWAAIALPTIYSAVASDLNLGESNLSVLNAIRYVFGLIKQNGLLLGAGLKTLPQTVMGGVNRQIQYATGDFYTGMVDENADEPIGVYLVDLQTASERSYIDEYVTLWGVVRARTLNPDSPIHISTSCYATHEDFDPNIFEEAGVDYYGDFSPENILNRPAGDVSARGASADVSVGGVDAGVDVDMSIDWDILKTLVIRGDADPSGPANTHEMTVAVMDEKDINCEFAPGALKAGVWTVFFSSKFNFDTHSYLKSYFIDQERLRAIRRQNKDPFSEYGITDANPYSISTNGPVQVNIKVTQPLTGLSRTEKSELRIGITLQNRWQGEIKNINDLYIKIPPSMSIAFCDYNFKPEQCSGDECEDGKYSKVYRLQKSTEEGRRGSETINNIQYFQTFNCKLNIDNPDAALGATPFATHFFKVSTDYTYELRESIPVTIEEHKFGS
ncbi:MAG: hypothetical protein KKE20_04195 [Nanoarchaeota archaeon]|nr:hypothetical protein [Nanoarchaeota archaeon]